MMDWTPETHDRFRGFSLREGQELLAQVPLLPAKGGITDLGCGSGTGGALLRAHFARRPLHGVDGSGRRLEEAEATGHYTSLESADIADWQPREAMALIFANGVLQRLGNHPALLPRLARGLCPGGVLAVQMPLEQAAPALVLLRALLDGLAGGQSRARLPAAGVLSASQYARMLDGEGRVTLWQTTYFQMLPRAETGHPVRHLVHNGPLRCLLAGLSPAVATGLLAAYDAALAEFYPLQPDGRVFYPSGRLFLILHRGGR